MYYIRYPLYHVYLLINYYYLLRYNLDLRCNIPNKSRLCFGISLNFSFEIMLTIFDQKFFCEVVEESYYKILFSFIVLVLLFDKDDVYRLKS